MKYFTQFTSNTTAGSGNQLFFEMKENEVRTGRVFYRITSGGSYRYALLFSNIMDSTYADGSVSHKNLICPEWKILGARVGKCARFPEGDVQKLQLPEDTVTDFRTLTFSGGAEKEVMPGEFFSSDPQQLSFESGEYLCLEITYSGRKIPYHEESILPVYNREADGWKYDRRMPFAGMIGCDRPVRGRIAYLGDSITQGIGTPLNSYMHWNAKLSEKLGEDYAFWNLGIGYGRADDAASDGAWLYKAKQNDTVFICYGVNDIFRGFTADQIKKNLSIITETLKKEGCRVIVQTVPPFSYQGENIRKWEEVNRYIREELCGAADFIFDTVPVLRASEKEPYNAKYGGHPNEEGCAAWADALYQAVKELF